MADIELVIKIPEWQYRTIKENKMEMGISTGITINALCAIQQGMLLPKGHWISHWERCKNLGVMPSGLSAYAWCSNCDCALDVGAWHRNHYNYCPNCGARMVEPQESEG